MKRKQGSIKSYFHHYYPLVDIGTIDDACCSHAIESNFDHCFLYRRFVYSDYKCVDSCHCFIGKAGAAEVVEVTNCYSMLNLIVVAIC